MQYIVFNRFRNQHRRAIYRQYLRFQAAFWNLKYPQAIYRFYCLFKSNIFIYAFYFNFDLNFPSPLAKGMPRAYL